MKRKTYAELGYRVGQLVDMHRGRTLRVFGSWVHIPRLGRVTDVRRYWYNAEPLPVWLSLLAVLAWKMHMLKPFSPKREFRPYTPPYGELECKRERARLKAIGEYHAEESWQGVFAEEQLP